jgi:HAD superfamily hydrolase (TIGR01490 family)
MRKIYLFDFDGTIYKGDSFINFTFFSQSIISFLIFWITAILKLVFGISRSKVKESFYNRFKGVNENDFQKICNDFNIKKIDKKIKHSFLNYMKNVPKDSEIIIVTASIKNYIQPWCDKMGYKLIATELDVENHILTGKFKTPNCIGEEKVKRIKDIYDLSKFEKVVAFGDTDGDIAMLNLASEKHFKYFKN